MKNIIISEHDQNLKEVDSMEDIRRFSLMKKKGTLDFITIITDKNKYAKVQKGYERCGR